MASSKKDLLAMPGDVIDVFGFALHLAQMGKKHELAKHGIETPKQDMDLIHERLKAAQAHAKGA